MIVAVPIGDGGQRVLLPSCFAQLAHGNVHLAIAVIITDELPVPLGEQGELHRVARPNQIHVHRFDNWVCRNVGRAACTSGHIRSVTTGTGTAQDAWITPARAGFDSGLIAVATAYSAGACAAAVA